MGAGLNEVTYEEIVKIKLDKIEKDLNSAFLDPQERTKKYVEMAKLKQELESIQNEKGKIR